MKHIEYYNKQKILQLYYDGASPSLLSDEYHIPQSTLFYWISKYPKASLSSPAQHQIKNWSKLVSHNKKLEAELDFIKRTVVKTLSLRQRMAIIDAEYGKESLNIQCEALDISRATYLNHRYRNKNDNAWYKRREAEYSEIISQIFVESGRVYGAKKIAAIMHKQGKPVSSKYVRKIMAESGLISVRSNSEKDRLIVARNVREAAHASQEFKVTKINQVWVSDTSAISIHHRYYYVCVYIDLFSRKVVGWGLGRNNSTQLTKRTFLKAYQERGNPKSLTIHTDNGACYTSYSFNRILKKLRLPHSFSRIRIPHDNAVAESFFNTMKRESIYLDGLPKSFRELEDRVSKFIEIYNSVRPHEHLDYCSPDEFEKASQQTTNGKKQQ